MTKLLPCTACRRRVSEDATACPRCGHPLADDSRFQAFRRPNKHMKSLVAWAVIGLAVVGVGIVAIPNDYAPQPSAAASDDPHGAWAYAQLFVKKQLKAPATADFPFGGASGVTPLGGGRYKVDSYVDSQNGFGATLRQHFQLMIKQVAGGWELESLNFDR